MPDPRTDTPSPFSGRFVGDDPFGRGSAWDDRGREILAEDRALQAEEQSAKEQRELGKQDIAMRRRMRGDIEQSMATRREHAAQYPEQTPPPEPPKPEDYHKISLGYLASMVLVGAFAGKAIRNAGNAPIAAFAGAAKGWNEGNMSAYKNATTEWEQANRRALELNRQQMEKYRNILQNDSLGIEDQMNLYKIAAMENQDQIGHKAADSKNFNAIAQHYSARTQSTMKWEDHTQKMVDLLTQQNESAQSNADQIRSYLQTPQGQQFFSQYSKAQQLQIKGFLDTYPAAPAPRAEATFADVERPGVPPRGPAGAAAPHLSPGLQGPPPPGMKPADRAARSFQIEQEMEAQGRSPEEINKYLASTGQQSSAQWARFNRQQHPTRSIVGGELERERDRREAAGLPPMTLEEEQRLVAEQRYSTSAMGAAGGQAGRMATGIAAFKQSLPLASQASTAVGARSKWVPYNELIQNVKLLHSDPIYGNFKIANETAITDYALAIGRGGMMTKYAQLRAKDVLNTARDDAAYQSGLRQLEKEANAIANAPAEAKATLLHQLFPDAPRQAIEEATQESVLPPAAPGGGGRAAPDQGWGQLRVQ